MKSKTFDIPDPKGKELQDFYLQVLKLIKKYGKNPTCAEMLGDLLVEISRKLQEKV